LPSKARCEKDLQNEEKNESDGAGPWRIKVNAQKTRRKILPETKSAKNSIRTKGRKLRRKKREKKRMNQLEMGTGGQEK